MKMFYAVLAIYFAAWGLIIISFSVYYLSNLMSNHLSRYFVCKRYAKTCGDVFGRKTAQLPKMSFTIVKKAMRYQDELHNLPIWVMSFC